MNNALLFPFFQSVCMTECLKKQQTAQRSHKDCPKWTNTFVKKLWISTNPSRTRRGGNRSCSLDKLSRRRILPMMACSVVKLSPYCTSHFLVGRIMCASTRDFQWGPKALNNPSAVRQLYLQDSFTCQSMQCVVKCFGVSYELVWEILKSIWLWENAVVLQQNILCQNMTLCPNILSDFPWKITSDL